MNELQETPPKPEAGQTLAPTACYPVPLSVEQHRLVKVWAEHDALWTTQDTVEFNLAVFARAILAAARDNEKLTDPAANNP